jgi:hypothetical protein
MATMTKTTPPITSDVPKKARLIARFGGLGFDIDVVNNDAESLFIGFILENRTDAESWPTKLSYHLVTFFNLWIMPVCMTYVESIEPKRWQKFVLRLLSRLGDAPGGNPNRCPVTGSALCAAVGSAAGFYQSRITYLGNRSCACEDRANVWYYCGTGAVTEGLKDVSEH